PEVLDEEAVDDESFSDNLLEYPHYTRPPLFKGLEVPEVLLSGHHANIKKWRIKQKIEITKKSRPDLYIKYLEGSDEHPGKNN
ncbi:MAG TPA: tRNA (guanosine(37)-N1)-methyltransferase TrmD, partial [Bacillota bacterium]|nr:tRNA (guanosine(37)-N1)-methyltransferase TrmD [Bacillota bacterium]